MAQINSNKGVLSNVCVFREGIEFQRNIMVQIRKTAGFFRYFDDEDLLNVFRFSQRKQYKKEDIIFREGSHADSLFIIISGSVKIMKKAGAGEEELAVLGPGKCFGEMGLLEDEPRLATAMAGKNSFLLKINEEILSHTEPFLCTKLFKSLAVELSKKLRDADAKLTAKEVV